MFGGDTLIEFLHSLDEFPDRARLAISDFDLPELDLRDKTATQFSPICRSPIAGTGQVFIGIMCAMADDYGTSWCFRRDRNNLDFTGRM